MQVNDPRVRAGAVILIFALAAAAGIAVGYGFGTTVQVAGLATTVTSTVTGSNSTAPYVITLVITTENIYNSTYGDQPAYYVLGPNGLESSAQIVLPAHRLIELVIMNYDDGAADLTGPQYASVTGTVGNRMTLVNNTLVNSTMTPAGIDIRGAENVSSLPVDEIAHTFTIPSLGLNVPVGTSSTVVVFFTIDTPGTYTWLCMTACGAGADGLGGAMATPGWMEGSVVAQ